MKLMGRETIIGADCGQAVEAIEGENTNYLHEDEIDGGKSIQSSKLDEVVGSDEMSSGSCKEDEEEEDVDCVKDEEFPEGSVPDERPHKRIHSFYFVKFPYYQDPMLRTKVEQACELVRKKGRLRHDITEEIKNKTIRSLHHRIQHKSKNLIEEKQLLRVIKQLEGTREKVIAREISQKNLRARYPSPIKVNVQTVIKMQSEVHKNIKFLEKEQKTIDRVIKSLLKEQTTMSQKQAEGHEILYELWKEHEEENASFYKNRSLLNYAKDLAAKRDIAALQKLSHRENEKFMSLWSNSKAVRDEYGKKILSSLDSRQLSIDGRIRNPDENPLILEAPTSVVSEKELAKLIFDTIESIVLPLSSLMRLKGHVQKKREPLKFSQHL